ncbi:MAG: class I lanthipeptide [Bacteroidales bacterium]|jgi:natural product precursor|nr:class I lanthipeptide [Bacteroidales bacterium]
MEKLNKKLQLNKEFIASLDKFEMTHVRGGDMNTGNGYDETDGGNIDNGWGIISFILGLTSGPTTTVGIGLAGTCVVAEISKDGLCGSSVCHQSF